MKISAMRLSIPQERARIIGMPSAAVLVTLTTEGTGLDYPCRMPAVFAPAVPAEHGGAVGVSPFMGFALLIFVNLTHRFAPTFCANTPPHTPLRTWRTGVRQCAGCADFCAKLGWRT